MSQFFGCIALHASLQVKETAQQMQESLTFFTGDGTGIYETNSVFICNKILHNTPESVHTPLICQNEQYVLAASCRLDNRAELAQKLALNTNQSDHEYLLAAYTQYKQDCVKHLIGDFSFVIWDKQAQQLFMAKDHLGIKPLFYYQNVDILLFATSITAIKAVQFIDFELNKLYIAKELKFFTQNFEDTFYQDIKRLKPAHFLSFNKQKGSLNEQRYWELTPIDLSDFKTEAALYEEIRRRLTEAVLCRTRTFKNIGCQLSGGMDSSAIAVLLARNMDKTKLHTYSFVLSDKTRHYSKNGIDEQDTQNVIIDYADLNQENHHLIEDFYYKDVFEQMDITYRIMGGYGNSDAIWQDSMYKVAQQHNVGYMMSGFPGDECISDSGSLYYYDFLGQRDVYAIARLLKDNLLKGAKQILSYYWAKMTGTYFRKYQNILKKRNLLRSDSPYHKLLKKDSEVFKFYPTFKAYLKNGVCRPHTAHRTESEGSYALAHQMETVYPLADIRLLECIYSLPTHMFKPHPYTRALFRNICLSILPDKIRLQPKFNGANTLAFKDYWIKKQIEDLKKYKIIDRHRLFEVDSKLILEEFIRNNRIITLNRLDYFTEISNKEI